MGRNKTLQELTIKDDFMFGAVMSIEENCRRLLELILGFPIENVEVSREKSIFYHPEHKGVRLDVYARDLRKTHYNVEMQTIKEKALGKRSRYYHSHMDVELLQKGAVYSELSDTYVIFICDFDPFGRGLYRYDFEYRCEELSYLALEDGCKSIFLSTHGKNKEDVPVELVKFLEFVGADTNGSMQDFDDDFVLSLQKSIQSIKLDREMEGRYMVLQKLLRIERTEGRAESVVSLLEDLGTVPEELKATIMHEQDVALLGKWLKLAAKSESVEQFMSEMQ